MRPIPIPGIFTNGIQNQVNNYKKYGFIIIKRNTLISTALIDEARIDILNHFYEQENTLAYQFSRYFNHVNTSTHRHSIALQNNISSVNSLLKLSISSIRNFLDSQLCEKSPLVEMSALLSQPGSLDQTIHSDIPWGHDSDLVSCMVAMQDISLENGPTFVYSRSHTKEFHKYRDGLSKTRASQATYYNNDGSLVEDDIHILNNDILDDDDIELKKRNERINMALPISAILEKGDCLIFNCKLFHFGSQNISSSDRLLLSFTFQKLVRGDSIPIKGFTYHLSNSMKSDNNLLQNYPSLTN